MDKLLLCPTAAGYSAQQNPSTLSVALDGGAGRYRADILNASFLVNVLWVCDQEKYDYLSAFERTATKRGSLPFLIDLILDDSELIEHEARFVPGSYRLAQVDGVVYRVEAVLEVVKPYDAGEASADQAIITAYESTHGGGS